MQRTIGASFSIRKEFTLHEKALKLQIRLDFQNPFKWYTLGNPGTTVDSEERGDRCGAEFDLR